MSLVLPIIIVIQVVFVLIGRVIIIMEGAK